MSYFYKAILILFLFVNNVFSQSKIDEIKSYGYQVNSSENIINENSISQNKYDALLTKNVFKYFDELSIYNSDLSKKIYKIDSTFKYNNYVDSLNKIISILSNSYNYKEFELQLEKYDLTSKSFYINNIKEVNDSPINWYLDVKLDYLQISNERVALLIENNRDIYDEYSKSKVNALVLINEFNNGPKLLKIIYSIEDSIIWASGNNKFIDSILRISTFKKENKVSIQSLQNSNSGSNDIENGFHESSGSGVGSIQTTKEQRQCLNYPSPIESKSSGIIVLLVTISSDGNVVRAINMSEESTISDPGIINQYISNVISSVRYNKKPGTTLQNQILRIDVKSDYSSSEISNSSKEFEVEAEFPGGISELQNFIKTNLFYPEVAIEDSISGIVLVSFVIGKDGKIKNIEIISKLHPACDREVLRVLNEMPRWKPALENGIPKESKFNFPIYFQP